MSPSSAMAALPVLRGTGRSRAARPWKVLLVASTVLAGRHPSVGFLPSARPRRSQEQHASMFTGQQEASLGRLSWVLRSAYSDMKVAELKELLSERGLKVSGRKAELIERLEESDEGSPAEEAEVEEANGVEKVESTKEAPKPAKATVSSPELKVGGLALAKYHEDGRYYTVTLKKDNGDGTFDIIWLEDDAEDTANKEDLKPNPKDFKKDDLVIAKCAEDGKRYTALVMENKGKGRVTVQYIEDESEEELILDNVWKQQKKFKKGQTVEAKFEDGEWYPATVKDSLGKGKYVVEWEDPDGSDPESELLVDDIQKPRVNIDTFEVGQKLQGEVKRVVPFGAFVDVGAYTDGLVHVSKMAKERVDNPEDYVSEDDEITVWVTSIDSENNKLGLTMVEGKKDFSRRRSREVTHPLADMQVGDELEGTIESVREFGCFVDVGAEKSGLVHISRMSDGFVSDPNEFASEGQKVQVWVSSIDGEKLGLSMVQNRV